MGFLSGMKIEVLNENTCKVVLKDRFWIHNPFGSVFWAVMGMAAELSTGALLYAWATGSNVRFILVKVEAEYLKKLKGKSFYFCPSGQEVLRSIESLENPGDIQTVVLPVTAYDHSEQVVAKFIFTWSLKKAGP